MIFICVKWHIRPEKSDGFLDAVKEFTEATRAEPGNIFFEWSKSVEEPDTFVLVEAFQDDAAEAHVGSDHFKKFVGWMPDWVAETPKIVNFTLPGTDWSAMAEIQPR